ncbi:MAG: ABC transporter substrate-binding protein [Clostridia bacterium]|nr:ABC transporter substrate-binding protein [Clostridia bacterium]
MKKILSLILAIIMVFGLAACGTEPQNTDSSIPQNSEVTYADANVYVLSGPTGIGAANLKSKADKKETAVNYNVTVVAKPDEVVAKISNGEADIAAIATNLAAKLYNKTNGGISILAVNTLGVLNVVTPEGVEVTSLADLKGKKVYTTGQGSNPEYIINYLFEKNGIKKDTDLTLEFKAEGTELLTVWANDPTAVIIAPQPVATTLTVQNPKAKIAIDLTDEWEKLGDGSALMMGCVVVRNEYLKENKATVDKFMEEYKASVEAANKDIDGTAALCETYGIVAKAAIAKKAIPNCNLCFISGNEMKTKLSGYLNVLFNADKTAVGGKLPEDGFYYEG